MNSLAGIIGGVKRNAKLMEEEFAGVFAMPDGSLEDYKGTLEEVALAHAVLRLRRDGFICPSCNSDAFTSLKSAILNVPENVKSDQPVTSGGNHDEGENQDDDTSDKCG